MIINETIIDHSKTFKNEQNPYHIASCQVFQHETNENTKGMIHEQINKQKVKTMAVVIT